MQASAGDAPGAAHLGAAAEPGSQQEIRFCTAPDGVRIAWAVSGEGPPLVKTANWLNHLEHDWENPVWRAWLGALGRRHTLVRYDERGNGLSDADVVDLSLEAFLADLDAVVEAAGVERYALLGMSQGAAVAIAHAARHPDRVTHLVVFNGFSLGWRASGSARAIEVATGMRALMRHGWGRENPAFRQMFGSLFFPTATPAQLDDFNEMQRRSASPENAVRLFDAFGELDARADLARVKAPTLVFHSRHDGLIPFSEGRRIAAGIPGARFVPLESRGHMLLEEEPAFARMLAELERFLAG